MQSLAAKLRAAERLEEESRRRDMDPPAPGRERGPRRGRYPAKRRWPPVEPSTYGRDQPVAMFHKAGDCRLSQYSEIRPKVFA
ncbi:hypothetical protein GCM10009596_03820 [Arthrobacter rhombi]